MKKIIMFVIIAALVVSAVAAEQPEGNGNQGNGNQGNGNEGFNMECKNFFEDKDGTGEKYYTIEKWKYENGYTFSEENPVYHYFDIYVEGNNTYANWTSDKNVNVVLVKAGNDRFEFDGGREGYADLGITKHDISHITFCGRTTSGDPGCIGDCGSNGVPEFSAFSLIAAVLVVTAGIVFIRKN